MKAKYIGPTLGRLTKDTVHEVRVVDNKIYVSGSNYNYMIKYSNNEQFEKEWQVVEE